MRAAVEAVNAAIDRLASQAALLMVGLLVGLCARPVLEDAGYVKPRAVLDRGLYDLATGENLN